MCVPLGSGSSLRSLEVPTRGLSVAVPLQSPWLALQGRDFKARGFVAFQRHQCLGRAVLINSLCPWSRQQGTEPWWCPGCDTGGMQMSESSDCPVGRERAQLGWEST